MFDDAPVLSTSIGELPLDEVELSVGDRVWSILHTGALIDREQEVGFLRTETQTRQPYGIALWPSAIALAHALAIREVRGKRILELGAGTGLPGIVAAALGARVVQTDRQNVVLHVCKLNAARNQIDPASLEQRIADWTAWGETARFDLIVGSDILYAEQIHPHLRAIFETNLAPGGAVIVADPFRAPSIGFFEQLQAAGWNLTLDKWTVGIAPPPRPVGVYTLTR